LVQAAVCLSGVVDRARERREEKHFVEVAVGAGQRLCGELARRRDPQLVLGFTPRVALPTPQNRRDCCERSDEDFWASEQTCAVKLVGRDTRDAVLDKLVYTATNPVLDHLVERVHHWPGINGLSALLNSRPLRATRPLHFFRPAGPMPDALEIGLTIPPELGPAAAVLAELRDRIRAVELERAAERQRTGGRILGRRAVLAQSWHDRPGSYEPRRNLRPCVAAPNKWARVEALMRNRAFAAEYADARARWRDGAAAAFPLGTYWLQRFAGVPVLEG
jgi:hypothetical protein